MLIEIFMHNDHLANLNAVQKLIDYPFTTNMCGSVEFAGRGPADLFFQLSDGQS